MSSFREGYRQGTVIGNLITLGFRIVWFFVRITWWLTVFLLASIVTGIIALTRINRSRPEEVEGFGHYSEDQTRWEDQKTGQWYPINRTGHEKCVVQATMGGLHWQRNALSRLVKRGAIFHYTFSAVSDGAEPKTIASEGFLNEARHNISLDDLDPAQAASDPYNLGDNRDEAASALDHLEWLLTNRGWQRTDEVDGHWYARIYTRPIIRWADPIGEVSAQSPEVPNPADP
jgi:hypothetical protein